MIFQNRGQKLKTSTTLLKKHTKLILGSQGTKMSITLDTILCSKVIGLGQNVKVTRTFQISCTASQNAPILLKMVSNCSVRYSKSYEDKWDMLISRGKVQLSHSCNNCYRPKLTVDWLKLLQDYLVSIAFKI